MTRRNLLIGLAAVVLVAIVGVLVFIVPNLRDNKAPNAAEPATTTAPPVTEQPESELNTGEQGFSTPDSDLSGRTVMIPNNPAGQPLPQRSPTGPRVECTGDGRQVTSPESMMIQRNFGAATLYSETDGPSRFDGLVLAGYTRTPQGAALAAANVLPRALAQGPVAVETAQKLTMPGAAGVGTPEQMAAEATRAVRTEPLALRASSGFRILSCTDSFAVVELAQIRDVDDNGARLQNPTYTGLRLNMVWDGGTWKARESTSAATFGPYSTLDGFTLWAL